MHRLQFDALQDLNIISLSCAFIDITERPRYTCQKLMQREMCARVDQCALEDNESFMAWN